MRDKYQKPKRGRGISPVFKKLGNYGLNFLKSESGQAAIKTGANHLISAVAQSLNGSGIPVNSSNPVRPDHQSYQIPNPQRPQLSAAVRRKMINKLTKL